MATEDMDRTVSSNPFVYDQLKSLGVSARVWDDVLDELFDEPFGNIPGPFGFLLADLNGKIGPQQLDYARRDGISDHDFVRGLLRQSIEELSNHPQTATRSGRGDHRHSKVPPRGQGFIATGCSFWSKGRNHL